MKYVICFINLDFEKYTTRFSSCKAVVKLYNFKICITCEKNRYPDPTKGVRGSDISRVEFCGFIVYGIHP